MVETGAIYHDSSSTPHDIKLAARFGLNAGFHCEKLHTRTRDSRVAASYSDSSSVNCLVVKPGRSDISQNVVWHIYTDVSKESDAPHSQRQ